jgi:hypothetical protein
MATPPLLMTERQALVALARQFQELAVSLSALDFAPGVGVVPEGIIVPADTSRDNPLGSLQPITLSPAGRLHVETQEHMLTTLQALLTELRLLRLAVETGLGINVGG